jgi:hypothetical protein
MKMDSAKKIDQIASGNQNCKIIGRLTRIWDSINMRSRTNDSLIRMDGIIIDEDVREMFIPVCSCYHF